MQGAWCPLVPTLGPGVGAQGGAHKTAHSSRWQRDHRPVCLSLPCCGTASEASLPHSGRGHRAASLTEAGLLLLDLSSAPQRARQRLQKQMIPSHAFAKSLLPLPLVRPGFCHHSGLSSEV